MTSRPRQGRARVGGAAGDIVSDGRVAGGSGCARGGLRARTPTVCSPRLGRRSGPLPSVFSPRPFVSRPVAALALPVCPRHLVPVASNPFSHPPSPSPPPFPRVVAIPPLVVSPSSPPLWRAAWIPPVAPSCAISSTAATLLEPCPPSSLVALGGLATTPFFPSPPLLPPPSVPWTLLLPPLWAPPPLTWGAEWRALDRRWAPTRRGGRPPACPPPACQP